MNIQLADDTIIKVKQPEKIIADPALAAQAVKLLYVNDAQEGIRRVAAGKGFRYVYKNKTVKDKSILERIRKLAIPPAWENVWICASEHGHLQATGTDARKRKQYKYHALWNELRNQTKFYRMLQFGQTLPSIRKKVAEDLSLSGMPREKVLAAVVALMEKTSIRIGSGIYEKMYGSFGLTTLKNKHVNVNGSKVKFTFKGKKGIEHDISIKSKKLATIVRHCLDIPGKELFQYYDEKNERQSIDSGMVNEYIRTICEADFTAKDFRTWTGTVQALVALCEAGPCNSVSETKKKILEVLDKVAGHLGNTRTICKKYYVHPLLLDMYENNKLEKYQQKLKAIKTDEDIITGMNPVEKLLLDILKAA
ncbi:MAG TPA: DNA topoisomerase IB [Chitinophagaceae bacterium]|nr:DNA topoisomerase IB [Chitinophagaceae bacterium]